MSFTTGDIVKVFEDRVYIIDSYGSRLIIPRHKFNYDDEFFIRVGMRVIVHDSGTVELASGSFNRWREELEVEELGHSLEITSSNTGWE